MKLGFALLVAVGICPLFGQNDFELKDQDTVVFYGDSITDQRLYTTFVETYTLTRFPERHVRFIHSGWGGDRVTGGGGGPIDLRLQRDVFAYKPTVVSIMLGMNDARYDPFDTVKFETYTSGYQHILDSIKVALPDARVTVIQPSPYDDVTRPPLFEGGYNAVLLQYSAFLADMAAKRKLTLADLNRPVVAMLEKAQALNPVAAKDIIPDRVHPSAAGHLAMAESLLRAWHAPAVVTTVELDAASGKVLLSENTKVTDMRMAEKLSWTEMDRALPMPVNLKDPLTELVLRSSDFTDALNREMLTVKGLKAGEYTLFINGETVAPLTADQLRDGVNLAILPTPMAKQAAALHFITVKRAQLGFMRWRMLQVALPEDVPEHLPAAVAAVEQIENDLLVKQRTLAQPVACTYEIVPVMYPK